VDDRGNDQADGGAGIRTDRDVATDGLELGGELRLGGVELCEHVVGLAEVRK
jgi:hypothetical protein